MLNQKTKQTTKNSPVEQNRCHNLVNTHTVKRLVCIPQDNEHRGAIIQYHNSHQMPVEVNLCYYHTSEIKGWQAQSILKEDIPSNASHSSLRS